MHLYTLLDAWPRRSLRPLVVSTSAVLGIATLGLPFLDVSAFTYDGVAILVVTGLGALWGTVGFVEKPRPPRDPIDASVRHRAMIVGQWQDQAPTMARLPEIDPAYSLIGWSEAIRKALEPHLDGLLGPLTIEATRGDEVTVWVAHRTEGGLSGVRAVLRHVERAFSYVSHERIADPFAPTTFDPAWPAARRALLCRAEVLDEAGFEALFEQINAEIDRMAGVVATSPPASPYLSVQGAASVDWWARGPGIPPLGRANDVDWLSVEEDAWHERIEVRCGARILGLCRRAGQPDAPWQLWRLRSVA